VSFRRHVACASAREDLYRITSLRMSDDEAGVAEDPRITTLYSYADKHTPAEYVAKLDELGTDGAVVLGNMMTHTETARMHFVVQSIIDADEDMSLVECLTQKRPYIKAACADGGAARFAAFLAALESFVMHLEDEAIKEASVQAFDAVLKACWEWELVDEESLRAWVADERAARYYQVSAKDAIRLRERGQAFIEWVDAGEP
jgi:hypothetical protein